MGTTPPEGGPGLDDVLAAAWAATRGAVLERVELLEDAVATLLGGTLDAGTRRAAVDAAHKLAGSLGSFGFPAASSIARDAELLLDGTQPISPNDTFRLSELAVALGDAVRSAAGETAEPREDGAGPRPAESPDGDPGVLVLLDDLDRGGVVAERLRATGARARAMRPGAWTATDPPPPVVVAHAAEVELGLLADLGRCSDIVLLVAADDPLDRVDAAQRGTVAFLDAYASADSVAEAASRALERRRTRGGTILVVDDDLLQRAIVTAALGNHGFTVVGVADADAIWGALAEHRPDMLVLDLNLGAVSGLDVCAAIRADPTWHSLPILVVTASVGPQTVRAVFAAGADDYVPKPIVIANLVTRVVNRLDRLARQRQTAGTDPLTLLPGPRASERALGRIVAGARRTGQPVAVAVVHVDDVAGINRRDGHEAGDAAIRSIARVVGRNFVADELVGRWHGPSFVVASLGTRRDEMVDRLAGALEAVRSDFSDARWTFTAGVADSRWEASTDPDRLLEAASKAVRRGREDGGDGVVRAGAAAGSPLVESDVVVIDDDEALVALLVHALGTRGQEVQWFSDGAEAAAALTGGHVRAPVVILDIGLPGLDGLSLLRRLRDHGVLERSRVIMLTLRASEQEMLDAFELGAFDYVAKPASIPVLLHRIRRAAADSTSM